MPLFQKIDDHIIQIDAEKITTDCVLYDTRRKVHDFYTLLEISGEKRLYRFPIRLSPISILGVCYEYHAISKLFNTTPLRYSPPHYEPNLSTEYLTQNDIASIESQVKIGLVTTKTTTFIRKNEASKLTEAQQRQLSQGLVYPVADQSFLDYITSLPLHILEASIRADYPGDVSLTRDDDIELRAFLYTYLNPLNINTFLLDKTDYHPTLGEIYDYYVWFIQQYIISQDPSRAPFLLPSKTLITTHAIPLGAKADFQGEAIENPQGLSAHDDKLFRCTALMITARPDGLDVTLDSIFTQSDFKNTRFQNSLFVFLHYIIQADLNQDQSSLAPYIDVVNALQAIDNIFLYLPRLIKICTQLLHRQAPKNISDSIHHIINADEITAYLKLPNTYEVLSASIILKKNNVANRKNACLIAKHPHPLKVLRLLYLLQEATLISQHNFEIISKHSDSHALTYAMNLLQKANILTQENFWAITNHPDPRELAHSLRILHHHNLLNRNNRHALTYYHDPRELGYAIIILKNADILTRMHRELLVTHHNPGDLALALSSLQQASILTRKNYQAVCKHRYPGCLASLLIFLNANKILTEHHRIAVARCDDLGDVLIGLKQLLSLQLLTQKRVKLALTSQNPAQLLHAFACLHRTDAPEPNHPLENILFALTDFQTAMSQLPKNIRQFEKNYAKLLDYAIDLFISLAKPESCETQAILFLKKIMIEAERLMMVKTHDLNFFQDQSVAANEMLERLETCLQIANTVSVPTRANPPQ